AAGAGPDAGRRPPPDAADRAGGGAGQLARQPGAGGGPAAARLLRAPGGQPGGGRRPAPPHQGHVLPPPPPRLGAAGRAPDVAVGMASLLPKGGGSGWGSLRQAHASAVATRCILLYNRAPTLALP